MSVFNLSELKVGEFGQISTVGGSGSLRQHFLDMGVIPGAVVEVVKLAPMGDPMEIRIHGYELTLRLSEAEKIEVVKTEKPESEAVFEESVKTVHPWLGEPGVHHTDSQEMPFDDNHVLTFALVGNQNCGKTTLFNQLTGAHQHVGNFPGVTVDRKDGVIIGYPNTRITDLPGIYSLSPYSSEELVSRNFVLDPSVDGIINIIDATNIERNLYLTMQLLEMDRPMVIALNMMDELTGNGGSVDINLMELMLGVPVVPICAMKNEGVAELIDHAIHTAKYKERPLVKDHCREDHHGGSVHRGYHAVCALINDHCIRAKLPTRFCAAKVIEGDQFIIDSLDFDKNELEMIEHITVQMEAERGIDKNAAMADMRYAFIMDLCNRCVRKPMVSKEHQRSERIDRILTGRYTALPLFVLIMGLVFYLTFNVIGAFFQDILEMLIAYLTGVVDQALTAAGINATVHGLIVNGIFEGVGSVLSFLPIVVTMFFFLSLLEDSGYIARVAFVMDKLLRKIGLSGRSIVPLLIGFGCSVPAIMSTRTLPSDRDRRMTILLTPFMSCTAKLPIYAFFVATFFKGKGGLIMTGLYLLGIVTGILTALAYKNTLFKGEAVPFVMELPNYRLPSVRSVGQLMWEKAKDFLQKAFSVIMVATIVVWFMQSFDFRFNLVSDSSLSIMAMISKVLVPLFKPLGLGDWRIATSLISGFIAKESVVSTMEVLFAGEDLTTILSISSAMAMLVFSLLYTPCVAAVAAVRREMGAPWAATLVFIQCTIAWIAAFAFKIILGGVL